MQQSIRLLSRLWLWVLALLFAQLAQAQVSFTSGNLTYSQDFNTLPTSTSIVWANNSVISGWYASISTGTTAPASISAGTGSLNSGNYYSFGSLGAGDRSMGATVSGGAFFGSPASGAIGLRYGVLFQNNTGNPITALTVTYTGEQWRNGGNTSVQPLTVDYTIGSNPTVSATSGYTVVSDLTFNSPITGATAAALDGNATANRTTLTSTITFSTPIAAGQQILLRWTDLNDTSNDHGLGIDDLSVTATVQSTAPTLSTLPITLNGFSTTQGTASATQTYALTGSNLSADVTVTAPADYEISQNGTNFQNSLTVARSNGSVNATISVRLTGATAGSPSGNITNVSGSASTNVAVSGTVSTPNAPALTVNPIMLSGFSTTQGTVSAVQTYALTGSNLSADVTVTAPTGYQVSQDGNTFQNSVTVVLTNGSVSATISVRLTGATAGSPAGTITNVSGTTSADVAVSGTVGTPVSVILISQIQGSGSTAALTGTQTIEAIVTRTFLGTTRLAGFYVQEEDADSDGNPATSEGIFVYDPSGFFTGNVGDKVRITGTVSEFTSSASGNTSSLTQITLAGAGNVSIVSNSNSLPGVTNVQLPVANVSDLEQYEGMLINMSAASGNLVATEYFQIARFGQVVLSATGSTDQPGTDARLDQYTQFFAPSVSGYTAYLADIAKRRIILDDGSTVQNPDPIIFGRGGQPLSASNTLRGGDQVASITAILDQRLEGYRLQTTNGADANFIVSNPRSATPPAVNGTLKAGSFNVLNYFTTFGTGNFTNCAGNAIAGRGANNSAEFTRQRDKVIRAIVNSGVEVMSLNEIQNNGFGSNSAIQDLINGLNAVAGANSYTFVNSGCISSDAITVAMIYKPSQVTPVEMSAAIPFAYGTGSFTSVGRRALAQTFRQNANGAEFTLVANHWKSKGSGSGSGDTDAGDGQGASNGTRTRQAQDLVSWLATKPTGTTDPDYLIVGDLNSYAQEDPLKILEQGGYTNLVPNSTYSYVFDGFVGALDHALRSPSLQSQIAGADKWHINSDEPTALDYNTEFKSAGQINSLYSAEPYRASDHDPVIVGLSLTSPVVAALTVTASASPTQILTTGSTTITASVSGGTPPYSYAFTGPGTITPTGNTASVSGLSAGVQTFTVTATDATTPTAQTSFTTVSVTVTMANTAPTVANAVGPQSATVGTGYTLSVASVFTDAETPNQLSLVASGLPAGLSLTGTTISGTPSMSGVSTVSLTATDPGSLSASTSFTLTVSPTTTTSPTPTGPFSITGVTLVSCTTLSVGERQLSFSPQYGGVTGETISFSVVNELASTTAAGPYSLKLYTDNPVITLSATQGGTSSTFGYNWLAACTNATTPAPTNTAPTVANAVGPQSATVGTGYTLSVASVFTDAETPNQLSLVASGLPAGLSLTGSTISGTPSTTMGSPYTVTLTATDPGSLSASTSFTLTVSPTTTTTPTPTGPFSITGVTLVSCTTLSVGERQLSFSPQYGGVTGETISFSVVNELASTTAAGPYSLKLYTDNPVITLSATQGGTSSTFGYNWLTACTNPGTTPPPTPTPTGPFSITGVTLVSCVADGAGARQISFSPRYGGVDGSPVSFSVGNELASTTAAGPYSLKLYTDNPVITLSAVQTGVTASYAYNWLAACNTTSRVGVSERTEPLTVTVLGNPVAGETVSMEIRGAAGQSVRIQTVDSRGYTISDSRVEQAADIEKTSIQLRQAPGVYLLQVSTATQQQTVKLIRE